MSIALHHTRARGLSQINVCWCKLGFAAECDVPQVLTTGAGDQFTKQGSANS